jgi:hypothetical protein
MNPPVPLDLGDFFFCKRYGHLMGWSMPVDLGHMTSWTWDHLTSWTWGHDVLDLGYDVLDLDYVVLDLGYVVLDKTRRYMEEDQDKSQDKILR